MDVQLEEIIVKSFFCKQIQPRVLFELSNIKKRNSAIQRLSHNYFNTLREEFACALPRPNSEPKAIEAILRAHGAGNECYAISSNKCIDGRQLALSIALEHAVGCGTASLISCIPDKLVYFEAEQECGAPPRFLLMRSNPGD